MLLKDIYNKPIERAVNPAVSATKFDRETVETEIREYVFTSEIMNGLYRILNALKNNKHFNHIGIWIDGYYGSGKSHFLKYLDYLISPDYTEEAFKYFIEAVKAVDPMDDNYNLDFSVGDLQDLARWMKNAKIDTSIFNLETSFDTNTDKKLAFLNVFWSQFNALRGFNKYNIVLAQTLERTLNDKGKFEEFKARIAEEGGNWDDANEAATIIDNELDWVLDIAQELVPTIDKESMYQRIIKRDINISIERFAQELNSYLKDKDENYRMIFLADEVSQFINKEHDRYLNLQEVVTKLSEECGNRIWVACTAQQDLSEVLQDCRISDDDGKIKGRFEVKVSLKGTQPEVITQKRILDKKSEVLPLLEDKYHNEHTEYDLRFKLPATYEGYKDAETFAAYYPFVPYQFKLIMQVFNSFLNLGYVAKEVKGNERSIIKVVHATAKNSASRGDKLGRFVSFDELYNNMFEEGLQARGQRAVDNALQMARTYQRNPVLARRVANVLFMICNISSNDRLLFPANLDNVTTLLINDVETPRLNLKKEVEDILEFFVDNNIIRREQGKKGQQDYFIFYSEEEMQVAELIKNQQIDNNFRAEFLEEIFEKSLKVIKNKVQYGTRYFTIGLNILDRTFLGNKPDITVGFVFDVDYDNASMLAANNFPTHLLFYLGPKFQENRKLQNQFLWYCKVKKYLLTPRTTEENDKIRDEFSKQAQATLDNYIRPELMKIFDTCEIISEYSVIDDVEVNSKKGADRYNAAMDKHLSNIYFKARMVQTTSIPRNSVDLKAKILRSVQPGEYQGLAASLTEPEKEVETYLNKQYGEVSLQDVIAKFSKAPYGWDPICTLYVVNELVRRHKRAYSFNNDPNVDVRTVANNLASETGKFTVHQAAAISPELVNNFLETWRKIFGVQNSFTTTDSTEIFRQAREPEGVHSLYKFRNNYGKIAEENRYSFITPVNKFVDMVNKWLEQRDPVKFFQRVIEDVETATILFDQAKEIKLFVEDQLRTYKDILSYVRANSDNFEFVSEDYRGEVEKLKGLENAEWPINIREYKKALNAVELELAGIREEYIRKIKEAYTETYEQLEKAAMESNVPVTILPQINNVIFNKTQSKSINVLKNNLNTNDFFLEYATKIQHEKIRHTPPAKPTDPGVGTSDPSKPQPGGNPGVEPPGDPNSAKLPKTVTLNTRQANALQTEEDVEEYLKGLKAQLMSYINRGDSIIIG